MAQRKAGPNVLGLVQRVFDVTIVPREENHLSASLEEALDKWFEYVLSEREAKILKRFHGIGMNRMSADQIGIEYDVTAERVHQLKEKGIRKLRRALRSGNLNATDVEKLVKDAGSECEELEYSRANDPKFLASVKSLGLGARAVNCLKSANIATIEEVLRCSEGALLKHIGFGRKSLADLKDALARRRFKWPQI